MPLVVKNPDPQDNSNFPVAHYSYSSLVKFTTNPILFKIQYINRERFETTSNISGVIGRAFHAAMEVYYGGVEEYKPKSEAEAIKFGMLVGMDYLNKCPEGFIEYSDSVPNKQKALDMLSFGYNAYVKAKKYNNGEEIVSLEDEIEEWVSVVWRGRKVNFPVKLKGYLDKVVMKDGKLKIIDFKTCRSFSDPEKIDGAKIIQAVHYYFLAYAKYGIEPYSMTYEEVKLTQNRDGGPQMREYEMVFAENELYFDFYFRLYDDVTRALTGEMVYVPNVQTMFDNEVSMIAYIHRLDVTEETAKQMKELKVQNISELLKQKIQTAGNMRKLLKAVEEKFVSAKNLNYEAMENYDKIKTKLMEHGMVLEFDSKVEGATVDLYRYIPTIGLKMSRLSNYVADLEQVLGVSGVRVLAPIPNSSMVGFEVPRAVRSFPTVPEGSGFDIAIGQTIMGEVRRFDIREAPHILVAGASGAGKSVFLNAIIQQLARIPNAELHLFDPKKVELSQYAKSAVEYKDEPNEIIEGLEFLVELMNERYSQMQKAGVRNISQMPGMPYKFVIIDEFGDLMMTNRTATKKDKIALSAKREEVKIKAKQAAEFGQVYNPNIDSMVRPPADELILMLAQKARAAGIHVIISTQRPSVDIISGSIKANFPVKVVFKTAKQIDSKVTMDEAGAEKLLGKGDMLFSSDAGIERLQGFNA